MSKKMMKRSLALGALMAFVITGSAMAANVEETIKPVDLTGDTVNVTVGADKNGIYGEGADCNVDVDLSGNLTVESGKTGITIKGLNNNVTVDTTINAKNVHVTSSYDNGVYVTGVAEAKKKPVNVTISADEDIRIATEASGKYAVFVDDKAGRYVTTTINAGGELALDGTVRSKNAKALNLEGKSVVINSNSSGIHNENGSINVVADEKIKVDATYYGVRTEGTYGIVSVSANNIEISASTALFTQDKGNLTVDATGEDGKAVITGNVTAYANSTINVGLGANGSLTGKVTDKNNTTGKGVNLDLGAGSTWNVTGESNVSTLSGSGTIAVTNLETGVTVATNNTGDITVATSSDNLGFDTAASMETLSSLVACGEEGIADKLVFTAGKYYDDVTADVTSEGIVITKDKTINEANINVSDAATLGMMSWRAEMNDMNKRMGELRNANGDLGVWVRMVRGEDEYNNVKTQYNQYQLGYDEKLSIDERWTVGMALSYTDGETTFAKGNGENTNKALSVYGSKLNADGTFIDLIAKYARLENEFNVTGGIGGGEYSTNGYSVSAEFGKRIQQGNGLWIEPQAELSYGKVSAVDYVTKNGVNVAQDGMESIVGRVGFSIGKDIEKGNVYARASYLYDFDGETSVNLDGRETLEQDLGGGWCEVGVGANINLSKATYIYADVEKTFGGEVDTNWQWNLGVRYSF